MTANNHGFAPAQLEAARKLFAGECTFMLGVAQLPQLPADTLPEFAFAGRSNVGKSSLINALTGRKTLARTSNTPGRTQQMNFFNMADALHIVDLPGYGYAKVSKTQVAAWTEMLKKYLRGRVSLRRAFVLVDSRHGIKDSDREIMSMLDDAAVPYQIILTKCDKIKADTLPKLMEDTEKALKKHPAAFPTPHATSSEKGVGIPEMRALIRQLAQD